MGGHLKELGFDQVYNKCEDFYAVFVKHVFRHMTSSSLIRRTAETTWRNCCVGAVPTASHSFCSCRITFVRSPTTKALWATHRTCCTSFHGSVTCIGPRRVSEPETECRRSTPVLAATARPPSSASGTST